MSIDKATNLTSGNIVQRITALAAPLIAASFIQMAYTMTDMAWLGKLGSKPIAAVGAASFIIWLSNSASFITKIGAEISISQSLGAGDRAKAKSYANHVGQLSFILSLAIGLIVAVAAPMFIHFFHLDSDINPIGIEYLRWIAPGLFFTCCNNSFGGIYYGTGNSSTPFWITSIGLVINMILDPLLIFGWGIVPALGTNGAGIATTLSQFVVFAIYIHRLYLRPFAALGTLKLWRKMHRHQTLRILRLGLPVSFHNVLFATISMALAQITARFGHVGVAVFSVGSQIESVSWMTASGFSTALGAFVGQNYGARLYERIRKGYYVSLAMAGSIGIAATIAFLAAGEPIFGLFINEAGTLEEGTLYLHILAISQLFMVVELVTGGAFNGVGRTTPPALLSVGGNLLRIPLALGLITFTSLGMSGVWWSITISSVIKGVAIVVWFSHAVLRKLPHMDKA